MRRLQPIYAALPLLALLLIFALPSSAAPKKVAPAQGANRILLPVVVGPPATVRVLNQQLARAADGTLYVTGEVINNLPEEVFLVYVAVRAYDAGGQVVASGGEHTLLIHTPVGGRNPFRVGLPGAPPTVVSYDITLNWSPRNRSEFRTLTLLDVQVIASPSLEVRGTVRNNDKKVVREGRVAITFYNEAGSVVDAEYATIGAERITSGSTAGYIIRTGRQIAYSRYEIRGEATIAP